QVQVPLEVFAKILPQNKVNKPVSNQIEVTATATFPNRIENITKLQFVPNDKDNLMVGRTKENDLFLDDNSISRHHATLVLNVDGKLRVADTGSTNGTFLNRERIAYGKAYEITQNDVVGFGEISVRFNWEMPVEELPQVVEQQVITATVATAQLSESYLSQQNAPQNVEPNPNDEPATVFGDANDSKLDDEPQTVFGKADNYDEPATVFGGANNEKIASATTQLDDELPASVETTIMNLPQAVENQQFTETSQLPSATRLLNSDDIEDDDLRTVLNQEIEPDLSTVLNKEVNVEPETVLNKNPDKLK
ncbi:MAG: FHA domain-containing protein, partial [Pyrinomonadaceae bacterium]|nr:FHA domain-containing protein [Pyrinomonadaceae bacterium]